ncbi:MAG: GTP pyrophosphokinase family protein [Thermodesulfobacteriota bacterium]
MKAISDELKKQYQILEPNLRKCRSELGRLIENQLRKVRGRSLVRVRLTESRIKSLPSVWRKGLKKGWKPTEILSKVTDLVGFRIVCANVEDVPRIREILVSSPRIRQIAGSEEDRTNSATESGYRDYKFYVEYEASDSRQKVTCEIQIRTLLQDSWASLTHDDIYKGEDVPESLRKLSYRLSQLIHVADEIAQDIREQVSLRKQPSKGRGKTVTLDSLRRLYKKAQGELPYDYVVQFAKTKCDEYGISSIKDLTTVIKSRTYKRRLAKAYKDRTGWKPEDDLIFQLSPLIAAFGIKVGIDAATTRGQSEWEEADQIYKREIASELPETFEEFLEYLEPHTKDDLDDFPERMYRLAEVFGALAKCSICAAPIVNEEIFSQNAQEYYGVEDLDGKVEHLVANSGADIADETLCPYHAYHRDD